MNRIVLTIVLCALVMPVECQQNQQAADIYAFYETMSRLYDRWQKPNKEVLIIADRQSEALISQYPTDEALISRRITILYQLGKRQELSYLRDRLASLSSDSLCAEASGAIANLQRQRESSFAALTSTPPCFKRVWLWQTFGEVPFMMLLVAVTAVVARLRGSEKLHVVALCLLAFTFVIPLERVVAMAVTSTLTPITPFERQQWRAVCNIVHLVATLVISLIGLRYLGRVSPPPKPVWHRLALVSMAGILVVLPEAYHTGLHALRLPQVLATVLTEGVRHFFLVHALSSFVLDVVGVLFIYGVCYRTVRMSLGFVPAIVWVVVLATAVLVLPLSAQGWTSTLLFHIAIVSAQALAPALAYEAHPSLLAPLFTAWLETGLRIVHALIFSHGLNPDLV